MADTLTFFWLINGHFKASAFKIQIPNPHAYVAELRQAIFDKGLDAFPNIKAHNVVLWQATIPANKSIGEENVIDIDSLDDKTKLDPRTRLSQLFPVSPDHSTYIIVEGPKALKGHGEEDAESSFKRPRLDSTALQGAIAAANLTQHAVVDGEIDLYPLNNKQRVALLGVLGEGVFRSDDFKSLFLAAVELRNVNIGALSEITATGDLRFPIVQAGNLYVRETYKELYGEIFKMFESGLNEVVVTGTAGIGKSVFLVYLAIRLLAESDDDGPPIVIFQTKGSDECYAFGGCRTVRSGNIKDFKPFLTLTDTWYFVDSSPAPVLSKARTVIAASPKILFSKSVHYHDIDKNVAWRYYMAPWTLEELKACRDIVEDFSKVPLQVVEELYSKIGGIPRYVLARAMQEVLISPDNLESVMARSSERLVQALDFVHNPVMLMQLFKQGKESLDFSGRLVHRWPVEDHRTFRLEWASPYVAEKIADVLNRDPAHRC